MFILQTAVAKTTGTISITIATMKWLHAITGTTAIELVAVSKLTFPAYVTKKKTFLFKVCMVESIPGWGSMISALKGILRGAIRANPNLGVGQRANQTTMAMKIVFILLASSKIIITDGMT